MKFFKRIFILLFVGALIAGVLFQGRSTTPVTYRTEKITRGKIADVVTASGTLNPVELINVGTQVSGQVSQLYVKLNDRVKAGQLLAEIDPSLLLTQIKQDTSSMETALSSFQQAERDLKRTRMLLAKDYVAKVDVEHAEQSYLQAKNNYDASKSILERDKVNLNYAKITSPINGIVISQDVTMGQTLASNFQTPNLFKIAGNLAQMKIDVNLSESDIARVKEGMKVTFTATAFPEHEFSGVVQTVNLTPTATQGVVMYNISVLADNSELLLLPGMTAFVSMTISEKNNILRVPTSALRFTLPLKQSAGLSQLFQMGMRPKVNTPVASTNGTKTIYLLKNDEPVPVQVTTGATDDQFVEISGDGIAEGDTVVTGIQPSRVQ